MPGSPVPNIEAELVPWLTNFSPKLSNYANTLGLTPAEVTATQTDIGYVTYLVNVRLPAERQTLAATVEFKNFIKEGDASAPLPATLPGTIAPPPYPTPVQPGALIRLRKLVQNIKSRPGYTDTIGQDLGIIVADGSSAPEVPSLVLVSTLAEGVTIGWNKAGWTGVRMQGRTNGAGWVDLGVDLFSPFVDTRPLAVPGQPEKREYRASYLDGDIVLGTFSQIIEMTVAP